MLIDINPKVLVWARSERGLSLEDVSKKLKIETYNLEKWEKGESIPFSILEAVAKIYKRQTAVFFLPKVPPSVKKIKDCRNLAKRGKNFSPDTLLAIRRTERYLKTARELFGVQYWNKQYEWIHDFKDTKETTQKTTKNLRSLLEVPQGGQNKFSKADIAFRYWRTKIEEKLGIFVFQFAMPENELDGFSYAFEEFPYAIVVNSKKKSVRKIFTLFHELAHILKHAPGVCKTSEISDEKQLNIELECNAFAGEFLVPSESVVVAKTADDIFDKAGFFNVSGEVYLRRVFDNKLISKKTFFDLLEDVRLKSNSFPQAKKKGQPSMIILSKSTRGNKFFSLITTAAMKNNMSYSVASDLLGLKVGNIRS